MTEEMNTAIGEGGREEGVEEDRGLIVAVSSPEKLNTEASALEVEKEKKTVCHTRHRSLCLCVS